ncbi:hypothetical protein [Metabacillus halosaccharovorans]|uniref:hypothetical protein n=1 Tax=Metabacillus halosaccharovorans TaxID=930124 RepID=UPI0009948EF2|nr:hypothetical protein [Metabacillus halosaccharovorans]
MNKKKYIFVWLLVKVTLVLFTLFCGLTVWALFQHEAYEVSSVFFILWLTFVLFINFKEHEYFKIKSPSN